MESIISQFAIEGNLVSCEPYGSGHINRTYLVVTDRRNYVLQCVSGAAFHNIPGLMDNVIRVTKALALQNDDPRSYLHLVPARTGGYWILSEQGEYWRIYEFVEHTLCLQTPESPSDFYESGVGFGRFQRQLSDFPIDTLVETIPRFHDTIDRYRILKEALEADCCGRAASVKKEIEFFLDREEEGGTLVRMRESGELPTRVTHNDTKLNNVLLDADTRKALCVIDLDTVMPGLAAYDYGDAIRFGASTAAEDEKDLDKVTVDLTMYKAFSDGFIPECSSLTEAEIATLHLGAKIMTLENGVRFLTDYLKGDVYYSIARPEHNLDRARTQIRLVQDMEKKWSAIEKIMQDYR